MKKKREIRTVSQKPVLASVPLNLITVKPQMRKTFEESGLEILAENIYDIGLLQPVLLNFVPKKGQVSLVLKKGKVSFILKKRETGIRKWMEMGRECVEYMFSLVEKGLGKLVLMAGERRYRAHTGYLAPRDLSFKNISANVYLNLGIHQHYIIQSAENTQVPVPTVEAARAYVEQYRRMEKIFKGRGEPLTKTRFARAVGRSYNLLDAALKFVTLPLKVQEYVERKHLTYGSAIELLRLDSKKEQLELAEYGALNNMSPKQMEKTVNNRILENKGQGLMLTVSEEEKKRTTVDIVGRNLSESMISGAEYINRIGHLAETSELASKGLRIDSVQRSLRSLEEGVKVALEATKGKKDIKGGKEFPHFKIEYR